MQNFSLLGCLEVLDLWLEKHFHRINGFLSLQLELRLELGWRLRLTKRLGERFGESLGEETKYAI